MSRYKCAVLVLCRDARLLAALALAAMAVCSSLYGAAKKKDPPWVAKDWTQWNEDDCDAVLGGSPWGQDSSYPGYASTTGPKISTVLQGKVQLRSALPIRQALLRKQQLLNFYSRMKPDKKLAFDQAHAHDLDPSDKVLVYIENTSSSTLPPAGSVSPMYQAPASPATQVALRVSDGPLIQPIETAALKIKGDAAYGNETEYSFPRTVSGKPLLTPSDSTLVVELGGWLLFNKVSGEVDQQLPFRDSGQRYTFKVPDMIYKGKLEY